MNVTIEIIPHNTQRYPTVGDWLFDAKGNLTVRVSKLSDWRLEMLIAIHELVEVVLCKDADISQESVDKFDQNYEDNRQEGDESEPGDAVGAPYRKQHCIATGVERLIAAELGVSWADYEKELMRLP